MSNPRIVDIKKLEKKPRVISEKKLSEEDFSLLIEPDASQELRKQQLRDILPLQPKPGDAISADVREKIEQDRKKRRGLAGDIKDALGLK